jgi:periplasmic protein TonB
VRSILIAAALAMTLAGAPAAQDPVYSVGEGIKTPVLVKHVTPHYTGSAMRRKVRGTVELSAIVLKDGTIGDVTITRSLDEDLDQEAIKAAKQWEFKPGTKDGEPVNVRVTLKLTFTLR